MNTPPAAPVPPPAAPVLSPAPLLDRKAAVAVPPVRHAATARTVGFVQWADEGTRAHLYSATGDFIATEGADLARTYIPAPAPRAT